MITSEQITATLNAYCAESKIKGLELMAVAGLDRADFLNGFIATVPGTSACGGKTIEDAISNLRATMKTPAQRAAELRTEAQAKLTEAELLEREVQP